MPTGAPTVVGLPVDVLAASAAALAGRLRDEVDLNRLAHDLTQVVDGTLQPTVVGLWLRDDGAVGA